MPAQGFPKLVDTRNKKGYVISGRIVTIGSEKECHIRLDNGALPSRVAHLLFKNGSYHLQHLSSEVPVAVNGKPVQGTVALTHGTILSIGNYEFCYRESDDALSQPADTEEKGEREKFLHEFISTVVSLLRNREKTVFDDLVFSVSRLLRSDASRLVTEDPLTGEQITISRYPRDTGLDRYSNRAITWAKQESHTVLLHDVDWKGTEQSLNSLEKNLVSSVLCAPLKKEGTTFGYLYLDRLQNNGLFTEEDRQFCDMLIPLFSEIVENHSAYERQRETIERLQKEWTLPASGMIFESKRMQETVQLAVKLAKTESSILILGETGTGKELLARFIHEQSQRASMPFKAINCGAIPENLIESELFGHEKGAFTGATSRNIGLFEAAHGGTLLLDEIGELPLQLQVKLLRVLQESEIIRVGGNETIPIDVRILAATNKNLEREIEEGRFRQDLYFRLNVLAVELPPLRDRNQDALLLADYYIKKYTQQFGLSEKVLSTQVKKEILRHTWPGNIRELENVMQKAILFSTSDKILPEHFEIKPLTFAGNDTARGMTHSLKEARANAENQAIEAALEKAQGNVSLAATMLEIDRKWLMKKMKEFGIDANTYR